jgi:hypothetical protein
LPKKAVRKKVQALEPTQVAQFCKALEGHPLKERRSTVVNDAVNKGFGVDSKENGEGV